MTFSHKIRDVDMIVEDLLDAVVQHAYGEVPQVTSDILSPTALDDAVFNGYDDVVVFTRLSSRLVDTRNKYGLTSVASIPMVE